MAHQHEYESDELDASLHELLGDLLALTDVATGSGSSVLSDPLIGDATLDFEDEDDSERSSTATSDPGHRSPGDPAPRAKKRRRDEVLRLREAASRLETELLRLQSRQVTELHFDGSDDSDGASQAKRRRRLRATAKHQIQAATRARLENAKLCDAVRVEAEVGSALQEALAKRRHLLIELEEECLAYAAAPVAPNCAAAVTPRERAIYDRLSENVDTRTTFLGPVLEFADTTGAATFQPFRTEARVLHDGHQSVCIEFIARYVIPFDFQAGAHVIWTQVLSRVPQVTSRSSKTEVVAMAENTLVTKHSSTLSYAAATDSAPLATEYSVSKRFAKAAKTEFAWESLTESQAGAVRLDASTESSMVNYVEEGWASVSHLHTRASSSAASVVQSHARLTLLAAPDSDGSSDLVGPSPLQPQQPHRMLTKHIISVYQQKIDMVHCFIESALLDAALRRPVRVASGD